MVIEKQPGTNIVIKSNEMALEQVKQYQYLGTLITEDAKFLREIKRRI